MKFWTQVRELNTYCGYSIAEDEILILNINGIDYIIDHDYTGKPYPKSQQVVRCGNAVCPQVAKALVSANLPEYCVFNLSTMKALVSHMAI